MKENNRTDYKELYRKFLSQIIYHDILQNKPDLNFNGSDSIIYNHYSGVSIDLCEILDKEEIEDVLNFYKN